MNRKTLEPISVAIGTANYSLAANLIDSALQGETGIGWIRELSKLRAFLIDGRPRHSILAKGGNSKLPFLAFSVLPDVTCSGAGSCLAVCYSFKAWRYPAAYARQAQNTALMQTEGGRTEIMQAFEAPHRAYVKKSLTSEDCPSVVFRLYVDGDFADASHVEFWFTYLQENSWLSAYGYSKSFAELLEHADGGGIMPANYTLNISSGHNHTAQTVDRILALPIVRGHFRMVQTPTRWRQSDYGTREYNAELRSTHLALTGRKAFPCPGLCGSCMIAPKTGLNQHACGQGTSMRNVDIIIAIH